MMPAQPLTPSIPIFDQIMSSLRIRKFFQKPGLETPPHEHLEPTVLVVLDGKAIDTFADHREEMVRDQFIYRPARTTHAHSYGPEGAHCLCFSIRQLSTAWMDFGDVPIRGTIDSQNLLQELGREDTFRELAIEEALISAVGSRIVGDDVVQEPTHWLSRVVTAITAAQHIPSLRRLSAIAGVHPGHLTREFKARYGRSIGASAREIRLIECARRLETESTPIATIAADAGFFDQGHFANSFRQATSSTPQKWRDRSMRRISNTRQS